MASSSPRRRANLQASTSADVPSGLEIVSVKPARKRQRRSKSPHYKKISNQEPSSSQTIDLSDPSFSQHTSDTREGAEALLILSSISEIPGPSGSNQATEFSEHSRPRRAKIEKDGPSREGGKGKRKTASSSLASSRRKKCKKTEETEAATEQSESEESDIEGRKHSESSTLVDTWKIKEKKALLEALKTTSWNNYSELVKHVPTRSLEQVRWFITRLRVNSERLWKAKKINLAPVEIWEMATNELLGASFDYSTVLPELLHKAAYDEVHEDVKVDDERVRWSCIYEYLASLMNDSDPPDLSSLEAAILVDILQDVSDAVAASDIPSYKELMQHRYQGLKHLNSDRWESISKILESRPGEDLGQFKKTIGRPRQSRDADKTKDALFSLNPWNLPSVTVTVQQEQKGENLMDYSVELAGE